MKKEKVKIIGEQRKKWISNESKKDEQSLKMIEELELNERTLNDEEERKT